MARYKTPHIDLWFKLTRAQQKKMTSMGYDWQFFWSVPMADFKKITKNQDRINDLMEMKRSTLRLVVDNTKAA